MVQLYTADQLFVSAFEGYNIRSTLNYENHFSESRTSVGSLTYVNEWWCKADKLCTLPTYDGRSTLILPFQESLIVEFVKTKIVVEVGQILLVDCRDVLSISVSSDIDASSECMFYQFVFSNSPQLNYTYLLDDLPIFNDKQKNGLHEVFKSTQLPFKVFVGAFVGKNEDKINQELPYRYAFVRPLLGTFEINSRLLFDGDSLVLVDTEEVDVECLSDVGIVISLLF